MNLKSSPVGDYSTKLVVLIFLFSYVSSLVQTSVPIWEKIIGDCFGGTFSLLKSVTCLLSFSKKEQISFLILLLFSDYVIVSLAITRNS